MPANERTFLITGASKGIGFAVARVLSEQGHHVIGLARTEPADFPGDFHTIDLGDESATHKLLAELTTSHVILGVVNNVGLVKPAAVADIDLDEWRMVMDLNVRTAIQTTQACLPNMRRAGWGRIVNTTSIVVQGSPERSSYSSSKAALGTLTRTWALELAKAGITVNAVAPGPTDTELFNTANPPGSPTRERYVTMVPQGRIAPPEEVAHPIAFLLSDEAAYITGQTLYVDGGATVGRSMV